jgi:hypothetical protein
MYRFIFFICLLFSAAVSSSQNIKKTIILVATTHDFRDFPDQDFQAVKNKLLAFKPQMICVEGIAKNDSAGLFNYRRSKMDAARQMRNVAGLTYPMVKDSISYYTNKARSNAADVSVHIKLGYFYYMENDFTANSDYQYWQAWQLVNKDIAPYPDSVLKKYVQTRRYDEFFNLVFPVAFESGIRFLYSVDDQSNYPNDILAQQKLQKELFDSSREALVEYAKFTKQFNDAAPGGKLLDLINDTAYQKGISGFLEYVWPKWSGSETAQQVTTLWKERNRKISRNIESAVDDQKLQRVIVMIGAAHISLLKQYLSKTGKYRVMTLQDLNQQ